MAATRETQADLLRRVQKGGTMKGMKGACPMKGGKDGHKGAKKSAMKPAPKSGKGKAAKSAKGLY